MLQEPFAMFFGDDRESESARLFEIASAANASESVEDLTAFCLDTLNGILSFEFACFVLCETALARIVIVQPRNVPPPVLDALQAVAMPPEFFTRLETPDALAPLERRLQELLGAHKSAPALLVPLRAQRTQVGLLVLAGDAYAEASATAKAVEARDQFLNRVGAEMGNALVRLLEREQLARERGVLQFLSQAQDGYWQTDGQGRITSVNDAALRTLKRTRAEIMGKRIDELSDADPEGLQTLRALLRRDGNAPDFILRVRASDGEIRTIRETLQAEYDAQGTLRQIHGIFRDITAQMNFQEALAQHNRELLELYELATRLNQRIGKQEALNAGLDLILAMTQADAIGIVLIHHQEQRYVLDAYYGVEPELLELYASTPLNPAVFQPGFAPEATQNLIEYMILTRRVMTMADFEAMPRFDIQPILNFGYQAVLAFPLYYDQDVYGIGMVGSKRKQFDARDTHVVAGISAQLGLALRNQQLFTDLQVQLRQMRAVAQTGRAIQYAPIAEDGLPQVVREICAALEASYVVLHLRREDRLERVTASDDREERQIFTMAPYEKRLLDSERPLVVNNKNREVIDPDQRTILDLLEMHAAIGVRLFANGQTHGLLFVNQNAPRVWTRVEIQLIEQFAQQIGYALANKHQLDEIDRQVRELQSLARAGYYISSAAHPDDALQSIAEEIARVFPAEYVSFHLREGEYLELIAESQETKAPRKLAIQQHQLVILEELGITRVNDVTRDSAHPRQTQWLSEFDIAADLGVPLVSGQKALGILYISYRHPHEWTEAEVQLALTFAQQIASTLTNARLLRESQMHVRELTALSRSAHLIAISLSPEHALPQAAQELRRVLGADYVGFHLLEGDLLHIMTEPHYPWANNRYPIKQYHRPVLDFFERIVVVDRDKDARDPLQRAGMHETDVVANVGVALVSRGKAFGILFVGQFQARQWLKSEVRLIETYAQQIAGVLDNVQLLNQTQKQVHSLEQLAQFNEIAATLPHREALIELAITAGKDLFNADLVGLALLEGDQFGSMWTTATNELPQQVPPYDAFSRKIVDSKVPFVMDPDNPYQIEGAFAKRWAFYNLQSALLVPLVTAHQNIGIIGFAFNGPHKFSAEEKQLAHTAANQLAMAFSNARFFREQNTQIQDLKRLSEFSHWCGTVHNSAELAQQAIERICKMLQANAGSIRIVEGEYLTEGASYGYQHPETREHALPITPYLKHILAQGKPFVRTDMRQAQDVPTQWLERHLQEGFAGLLLVPMVAENRPMGLLTLFQKDAYLWSPAEIQSAEAFTNTLALALSNTRQMEKAALRRNELQAILDSVFSAVLVTNEDGEIVSWSNKAQELTGLTESEMRGKRWDVEGPDVGEARRADMLALEAMADNEMRFSVAPRYLLATNGRTLTLREVATPLHDHTGSVRGAVVAFWDRSLEQAGERAKVDLINEVAHELGNKLALVLVAAKEVLNDKLSERRRGDYKRVLEELTDDVSVFHKRFLEFQKERVHEPIETTEINLRDVVQACLAPLRAAKTGHRFRVEGRLDYVSADEHRLRMVIGNLLSNAVKYAPARSLITIRAKRAPGLLTLAIQNRGEPIPLEVQPRLFQRGERGNSNKPGSGLGLWLVQTKLHEMGGEIRFESNAQDGTTFFITLKRSTQTPPTTDSTLNPSDGSVSGGGEQA